MKRFLRILWLVVLGLFASTIAYAAEGEVAGGNSAAPWLAIASGFGIAIAAFGGALGQAKAAAAALEGIARNPGAASKVQAPMIIALALTESLVIYALVISFMLMEKI